MVTRAHGWIASALDRLRDAAEAGVLEGVICLCADRLARAYGLPVTARIANSGPLSGDTSSGSAARPLTA